MIEVLAQRARRAMVALGMHSDLETLLEVLVLELGDFDLALQAMKM
jgi:hypothetical protein